MSYIYRTAILCLLGWFMSSAVMAHDPTPGLWFSPDHDGHGFDLQKMGNRYVVIFYTYNDEGEPVWYLSVASGSEGKLTGTFSLFEYEADRNPPQQIVKEPGDFTIDFANTGDGTACADASFQTPGVPVAVMNWNVDGSQGSWCVTPLLPQDQSIQQDLTGLWWAGLQDQGWGLSMDYAGEGELRTQVAVLFYFDSEGFPRWALGATAQGGANSQMLMHNFTGYCIECPVIDISTVSAGSISHMIEIVEGDPAGLLDLDIAYGLEPGGDWSRTDSPMVLLSDPLAGFSPIPQTISADQKVAIVDVTLIPMTEGLPKLFHQSVLIENGVIVSIFPSAEFEIPADAVVVDARGLYLAPGMTEMHLHITVGGQSASEQAGLMMIANGITTALNMGNSFSFDVPLLGDRFESGELIGPSLYAGQVAYGPDESNSEPHIVSNGPDATAYAEALKNQGFDYIKTYWQLPSGAIFRFQTEAVRLELPLIGHIPLRQPMDRSMANGHRMAAHIQEPYVSYMNSSRQDSLFEGAANVFLEHGSFLTPTLAVFESYVRISGNRRDNYNELIAREGQQYQPRSIKDAWKNYFNQSYIKDGDTSNLDDLLAFFYRMAKFFFDAGVPLLIGTDAPGFPGVMSGFGALEEMRLLNEVGIPAKDVFAIATRNAGQFVDDTLHPEAGFGTIEPGKRADLILTTHNPLESVDHLKRPLAVMARGRFWSQAFLQQELDKLRLLNKQQDLSDPQNMNTEVLDFGPHN
jgi:hypothetical protein